MKAIILCGGKGTRLGGETTTHQKCMIDVGGKPFLHYVVKKLKKAKYEIVFAVDHMAHEVIDYFDVSSRRSKHMYYFSGHGQVGAINDWFKFSEERALFVNGDTLIHNYEYDNHTVLLKEGKGLYRSAGIYYPYPIKGPYKDMDYVLADSDQTTIVFDYIMIEIGTPEGLQYARDSKELLC